MQRAGAHFRKLPGVADAKATEPEYQAGADALAEKLARLKELRLARDAARLTAPLIPVKKKAGGKKKPPAVLLSDWLKNRQAVGHSH